MHRTDGQRPVKVIAVASGKGGVGKTQVAVNLGIALAQAGRSTLLLDGDLGLGNVDVLLGLDPEASLEHVMSGEKSLDEILIAGPEGLGIVPAASGVSKLANLSVREQGGLITAFTQLTDDYEVLIVDTATGIDHGVLGFCAASTDVVVVLCDEPASMTDAYALVKLMSQERGVDRVQILCNRVRNKSHGQMLYSRFLAVCERFLNVSLCYFGCIPEDAAFLQAARVQKSLVACYPSSSAGAALKELAVRADRWNVPVASAGRPVFFAERLLAQVPVVPSVEAC